MPDQSQTSPFSFSCQGGLVLNQPTFNMQPGQALELLNFEPDIDGATAFVYQYRGETAQYQLNMQRFEQGIKNMQTLLINRFEYLRSTYIPRVNGNIITTTSRAL